MYCGRIVEIASAERVFASPVHPYTVALLSAIPRLQPGQKLERIPFDAAKFQPLPLREISSGHWAALE